MNGFERVSWMYKRRKRKAWKHPYCSIFKEWFSFEQSSKDVVIN